MPTPGLRSGLFNRMVNTSAGENTPENLRLLAQNDGMKKFSKSLELDDAAKVDLVVVGSVAVSKSGEMDKYYHQLVNCNSHFNCIILQFFNGDIIFFLIFL